MRSRERFRPASRWSVLPGEPVRVKSLEDHLPEPFALPDRIFGLEDDVQGPRANQSPRHQSKKDDCGDPDTQDEDDSEHHEIPKILRPEERHDGDASEHTERQAHRDPEEKAIAVILPLTTRSRPRLGGVQRPPSLAARGLAPFREGQWRARFGRPTSAALDPGFLS